MAVSGASRARAEQSRGSAAADCLAPEYPTTLERTCRIALIRQRWRPDGGAERQVNAFLEMLGTQPCDVTLLTRSWSSPTGCRVLECNPPPLGRVWREWGFARAVRKTLARHSFDLIQSHERIAGCDIYRAGDGVHREWLKQKGRTQSRIGRWLTSVNPYHVYVKHAEQKLFESNQLRAVICNSRMVRDEILHWFTIDPSKLHVVYNGIDTDRFHPLLRKHRNEIRQRVSVPECATLFAFVGSGFDRKGLASAIEALAKTTGTYLVVVGKDKNAAKFQRQARRLGVADRLRNVGVQADVGPYYGAADGLILPTLYDPFPNVAIEAMASGLPVITASKCGAAELIATGVSGYVCDPLDCGALAEAMQRITEPARQEAMGRAARAAVEPLNVAATRRRLVELYTELLG